MPSTPGNSNTNSKCPIIIVGLLYNICERHCKGAWNLFQATATLTAPALPEGAPALFTLLHKTY
jgi:hypothetical protein